MTNTLALNPVSPKQTDFINLLLKERVVPDAIREAALTVTDKRVASGLIGAMIGLPKKVVDPAAAARAELAELLATAEISKYAIPAAALVPMGFNVGNDLLFIEIRRAPGGRVYMRRLHGAPGAFRRSILGPTLQVGLLKLVKGRHVEFAALFGKSFGVCGRCAAPLTDAESRRVQFGPECRKVFGL